MRGSIVIQRSLSVCPSGGVKQANRPSFAAVVAVPVLPFQLSLLDAVVGARHACNGAAVRDPRRLWETIQN